MAVLLVTYDLNKEGKNKVNYNEFYKIRDTYDHVRLSESSYAIWTNETPMAVYVRLRPLVDSNDYVYVITLARPYYGFGSTATDKWLDASLPQ